MKKTNISSVSECCFGAKSKYYGDIERYRYFVGIWIREGMYKIDGDFSGFFKSEWLE